MKTLLASSFFLLTFAFALTARAESYFSLVNTVAYSAKDASPSDAHASYYSGYLCTIESADLYFGDGHTTAAKITNYVLDHYDEVIGELSSSSLGVTKLAADPEGYSAGQYAVMAYSGTVLSSSDYLALLVYSDGKNKAFRAFGEGSASFLNGSVIFDDNGSASSSTIGAWTAVEDVPEPTSGVLLLLGLAGLALKRKQRK